MDSDEGGVTDRHHDASEPHGAAERQRLAALRRLNILDTGAEERFDAITRMAARAFGTPMALLSLVDEDRQWFKSRIGVELSETSRSASFCAHAIQSSEAMAVPDALADPRFADNPLVLGDPRIRAYLGRPLATAGGLRVGTLCVLDDRPRTFDAGELEMLEDLARWAELELNAAELSRALEADRGTRARFEAVTQSVTEGIVAVALDGTVQLMNVAAGHALGVVPERSLARRLEDVLRVVDAAGNPVPWSASPLQVALLPDAHAAAVETRFARDPGGWFDARFSCAPTLEGTRRVGSVVSFSDVTERKALGRLRRRFVATVSHELRTPLTTISGYTDLLLAEEDGPVNAEQRTHLERIGGGAQRLQALVDELLVLSDLDAGRLHLDLEVTDLVPVLARLAAEASAQADGRGLRFDLELPARLVARVDARYLTLAVQMLVDNALKFTPATGRVALTARQRADELEITVTDEGPGVSSDDLPWLGTGFHRGESVEHVPGVGGGLMIARELVERHGGRLGIEPAAPGTRFVLTVPVDGGRR